MTAALMLEGAALVLLAFTVLLIGLAQLHLYRVVAGQDPRGTPRRWPLNGLRAGDALPASLVSRVGSGWTGLLLLCADDRDEYAAAVTGERVAREWRAPLLLLRRVGGDGTGWESRLPEALQAAVVDVSQALLDELGAATTPVLIAVQRGRLLDATQSLAAPSLLAHEFRYVAPALMGPTGVDPSPAIETRTLVSATGRSTS